MMMYLAQKNVKILQYENRGVHGDGFAQTPNEIEAKYQLNSSVNPFLTTTDTAALFTAVECSPQLLPTTPFFHDCIKNGVVLAAGDGSPPLLPINPFLQDCITNPFLQD
ncbi:hypothetical protein AVEN_136529-1, partial [Araneus ventricosus]